MRRDLTLAEQGVTFTTFLTFKNRFLLSNQHLDIGDELAIHFTYAQASALVNAGFSQVISHLTKSIGLLPVPPKILLMLWALQMQVFFGDHKSDVHKSGFLQFLVPNSLSNNSFRSYTAIFPPSALAVEQYILEKHKKRAGRKFHENSAYNG